MANQVNIKGLHIHLSQILQVLLRGSQMELRRARSKSLKQRSKSKAQRSRSWKTKMSRSGLIDCREENVQPSYFWLVLSLTVDNMHLTDSCDKKRWLVISFAQLLQALNHRRWYVTGCCVLMSTDSLQSIRFLQMRTELVDLIQATSSAYNEYGQKRIEIASHLECMAAERAEEEKHGFEPLPNLEAGPDEVRIHCQCFRFQKKFPLQGGI